AMSRALPAARRLPATPRRLPMPRPMRLPVAWPAPLQLAALGPVLCLHRADGSELAGWQQAVKVHACHGVDSEGVHESLCFSDAQGRCAWRLYLLPDSDFLAWDRLLAALPSRSAVAAEGSLGE